MSRSKRIEDKLSGFILFGGMMDEKARGIVAEIFFLYLYNPVYDPFATLAASPIPKQFPNWHKVFRRLFHEDKLRDLTLNNEDFAFSVAQEALDWCKQTYLQFETNHSYQREESDLTWVRSHTDHVSYEEWVERLSHLLEWYPGQARNWNFYRKSILDQVQLLDAASPDTKQRTRIEQDLTIVKKNIVDDWTRSLTQKKHSLEEDFIDTTFKAYSETLHTKIDQLHDLGELLSPFYNFLGQVWNDSIGNWNQIDWDQLESFAKILERDAQLRLLADLLGKWHREEQAIEDQKIQQPLPEEKWRANPYGKSEVVGIHHSDQISAMLPSEVALLSSPETETVLSKKYVEKKLLTFQYRSQDMRTHEETAETKEKTHTSEARGPFILCIDTSGSMFGTPERIAKALALAILNLAIKQNRPAYLISFSTGIQTMELSGIETNPGEMVKFLKMSFHGGTDLQPALEEAMQVLERERFHKADVLVISDFIIPRLSRKLFESIQTQRKEAGTHFHSLFITRRPDPNHIPLPVFDNHWVYDLDNPGVMRQIVDHFHSLETQDTE